MGRLLRGVVSAAILMAPGLVQGQEMITGMMQFGNETKQTAGAGTIHSRNAPSMFYNPANLSLIEGLGVYTEFGVMSYKYSYEYPGYKPFDLDMIMPSGFLGVSGKIGRRFNLSGMVLPIPAGVAKKRFENIPIRFIGENPSLLGVKISVGSGYIGALAGSYELVDDVWSVGATVLRNETNMDMEMYDGEVNAEDKILAASTNMIHNQYIFGTRLDLRRKLSVAASYKPSGTTRTRFTSRNRGGSSTVGESEGPVTTTLGAELTYFRKMQPFAEFHHIAYRSTGDKATMFGMDMEKIMGMSSNQEVNTRDTVNSIFGSRYYVGRGSEIVGAFGWYPANVGDGSLPDYNEEEKYIQGPMLGDVNSIDRSVYALGYNLKSFEQATAGYGASYTTGKRSVPESSPGYGEYKIEQIQITAYLSVDM